MRNNDPTMVRRTTFYFQWKGAGKRPDFARSPAPAPEHQAGIAQPLPTSGILGN